MPAVLSPIELSGELSGIEALVLHRSRTASYVTFGPASRDSGSDRSDPSADEKGCLAGSGG